MVRYLVLATDYDGTLATSGAVPDDVVESLERCRDSGRRLVLVTGRELDDLQRVFSRLDLFDWVVAENGAVLHNPETRQTRPLSDAPPPKFVEALRQAGVKPLAVGQVIVATLTPYETVVVETIRRLGLELQVIFNKGAVMVLPSGINKATGLAAALDEMGVSPHNVVAIGDAENDHALLASCEASAAVANAVPMLREAADLVTRGDHGQGVMELIGRLIKDDLADLEPQLGRHHILLGRRDDGSEFKLPPYGLNLLVAGTSGGGKSTLISAFLERLMEQTYQVCVIDPEGDFAEFEGTVPVGTSEHPPDPEAVIRVLASPTQNAVANMVGVRLVDRPKMFVDLLARLQELRAHVGRPHWIIVDEAHHVLPAAWETGEAALPERFGQVGFVTLEPDLVAPAVLARIDTVIAAGKDPEKTLRTFSRAAGVHEPRREAMELEHGRYAVWPHAASQAPFRITLVPGEIERRRHRRKYAEGELEPDFSFYFRGPESKLNLRAQNLVLFSQIAEGVDDETWLYHLRRGDYSQWFRQHIKDPDLAEEAEKIESDRSLSPQESRHRINALIEERYTLRDATLTKGR